MSNDEIPNDEGMTKAECQIEDLGLRFSAFFRASSFRIRHLIGSSPHYNPFSASRLCRFPSFLTLNKLKPWEFAFYARTATGST
jgi:hypothetical protein